MFGLFFIVVTICLHLFIQASDLAPLNGQEEPLLRYLDDRKGSGMRGLDSRTRLHTCHSPVTQIIQSHETQKMHLRGISNSDGIRAS